MRNKNYITELITGKLRVDKKDPVLIMMGMMLIFSTRCWLMWVNDEHLSPEKIMMGKRRERIMMIISLMSQLLFSPLFIDCSSSWGGQTPIWPRSVFTSCWSDLIKWWDDHKEKKFMLREWMKRHVATNMTWKSVHGYYITFCWKEQEEISLLHVLCHCEMV